METWEMLRPSTRLILDEIAIFRCAVAQMLQDGLFTYEQAIDAWRELIDLVEGMTWG